MKNSLSCGSPMLGGYQELVQAWQFTVVSIQLVSIQVYSV